MIIKKLELHRLIYHSLRNEGVEDIKAGKYANVLSNIMDLEKKLLCEDLTCLIDALIRVKVKVIAGTI